LCYRTASCSFSLREHDAEVKRTHIMTAARSPSGHSDGCGLSSGTRPFCHCRSSQGMNMITATYEGSPAEPVSGSTLLPRSLCDEEAVSLSNSPEKAATTRTIAIYEAHMASDERDDSEWVNGLFAAAQRRTSAPPVMRSVLYARFARSEASWRCASVCRYRVAESGALVRKTARLISTNGVHFVAYCEPSCSGHRSLIADSSGRQRKGVPTFPIYQMFQFSFSSCRFGFSGVVVDTTVSVLDLEDQTRTGGGRTRLNSSFAAEVKP